MQNKTLKLVELFLLFICMPISFAFSYPIWIKGLLGVFGFIYVIWILRTAERFSLKISKNHDWKSFWKRTGIIFTIIAVLTSAYVYYVAPEKLFYVPLQKPLLYIFILFVYSFFSVWPQEIIYRIFFMNRYKELFRSESLLVFINAIVFSLAHIFFRNTLVTVLTFLGGLLFAISYLKFKSTTLICIEHAIYGSWLFTVGMGEMLAFPGVEG